MDWKDNEPGPTCFCGHPTTVLIENKTGQVMLVCVFHTKEAGAFFSLPRHGRPDHWPNMTDAEMSELIDAGSAEQDAENATQPTPSPSMLN